MNTRVSVLPDHNSKGMARIACCIAVSSMESARGDGTHDSNDKDGHAVE